MLNYEKINDEVLYTKDAITRIDSKDIDILKAKATGNTRKRVRLCTHPSSQDALHEMLIVLGDESYVPPHKHPRKSESFHIIEGFLDVVIFDDVGTVKEVIPMAAPGSDLPFYYRLSGSFFHMPVPTSDVVVFHEITNGPFDQSETVFASWAPSDKDAEAVQAEYLRHLLDVEKETIRET